MTGLSISIMAYKLPTDLICPPVKQKLRKFMPDMSMKIKEEVTKKVKVKVLKVVEYPTWLDIIVSVPKKDGKIWMDEEDAEKMTFITPWGMYCYKMMPSGLKNAGATCMRDMTTIFHDMIHKEIEVYVDYVIIEYKKATDHMEDLRKFFNRLRRYHLKLKPAKCSFGVPIKKLLEFIKAIKGQALADHLAENPVDGEYEPLKTYFPDEEVSFIGEDIAEFYGGWRMFFDGATNFKGVGIVAVLVSETGQHYLVSSKLRFPCTNNKAEYEACILGLKMELRKRFTQTEFQHIPRVQNEFADALATISSMIQHLDKNFIDPIPVKIYDQPTFCAHIEEEADGKPCITITYLDEPMAVTCNKAMQQTDINLEKYGIREEIVKEVENFENKPKSNLGETKIVNQGDAENELRKRFTKTEFQHIPRVQNEFADALATLSSMLKHPDKNFIDPIPVNIYDQPAYSTHVEEEEDKKPCGGILYRRTPDLGLLRCVDAKEASRLLEEIYDGFVLAKKILRAGYFWITMEKDCIQYVQKFHSCQIHADMIKVTPNELNTTSSS
ncbi:uncharacterized protein [Nicotiana sylvestris]|uniref:uncharacterized protein n=1 Tax=Nicotiana sylvestris TaxID=4096 RepID=UPI00388C59D8